jgi:phosphoglycerate kinase
MQSFCNIDLLNKKVFLRADLNVPFYNGVIQDETRLKALLPTIELLQQKGAKIILASHFGRPDGKVIPELSLNHLVPALEKIFNCKIDFFSNFQINFSSNSSIILLENLRFDAREEANDIDFARTLASLADVYINDAFSCSHRAHSSITGITQFLPSYSGLLLEKEVTALKSITENITIPMTAIIAGKKVSTKFDILTHLSRKAKTLIVGGAMANTFLKAKGLDVGNSFVEVEFLEKAKQFLKECYCELILPTDFICAEKISNDFQNVSARDFDTLSPDSIILDIGPDSCARICEIITNSKTVIWNGPLGFYEDARFKNSNEFIARHIAKLTRKNILKSVIGGGDIVAAIEPTGLTHEISYVSTAGGAFLEWLEGTSLPGIIALEQNLNSNN